MAQILDLGKIRFNWAGTYNAGTEYSYNDLVKYGPNLYAYNAVAAATGVVPTNTGSWILATEGVAYKGVYTSGTLYYKNDIVTDNTNTYITLTQHTASSSVALENTNLEIIALGQEGLPNQTGNANKVLITDGAQAEWSDTPYLSKTYVGDAQGQDAEDFETSAQLTNTLSVFSKTATDFVQFPIVNESEGADASTDFIAYTAQGTNESGWIDMGITSGDFNAQTFGITGAHDGYVFMSAPRTTQFDVVATSVAAGEATITTGLPHGFITGNKVRIEGVSETFNGPKVITSVPSATKFRFATTASPQTEVELDPFGKVYKPTGNGNLVLATDETGLDNKIVFAAGGFATGDEQMSITPDLNVHIEIATESVSPTTGALTVVGGVGIQGDMNIAGAVNIVGDLTFGGGSTTTENLTVTDPLVFVGDGNPADAIDLGLVGEYTSGGGTKYAGVVRDASDGVIKFFKDASTKPTSTVNFSQEGLLYSDIQVASIELLSGATVNEFSTDGTLSGASNSVVPTENAVKTYVDNILGNTAYVSLDSSNYNASYSTTVITTTSSVEHRSIILPSALNAVIGSAKFQVHNKSSFVIGVRDNSQYLLTAIEPGGSALVSLTDNQTIAGEWAISGSKLQPFFISNQAIIPNASATATENNPTTNPILSVPLTNTLDLNVHANAAGTISAYAIDFSTTPATASVTPLIFNTGSNYTLISIKRISDTRAAVFTLTDIILLDINGTTVTLVANANSAFTSPVRNGTTTGSADAVLQLENDLYGVMFGSAATVAPVLTLVKFDGDVIRTGSLTLGNTNAVVNGWDAIVTSSNTILMAFGDSAATGGAAPWGIRFSRISVIRGDSGSSPSATQSATAITPTNIASAAAYSIILSRDESNTNKVCAIVGNNTAATINSYILTGATNGTIALGDVFTVETAATLFTMVNFGQTPLTKALQNVGADAWKFTYQGASNYMRVARITASGNVGSVTLPTYHGKNPASNITTLGPNFNNDVVIMSSHGQATTSYSGLLTYVNTGGTFQFKEFVPPAEGILFTTQRTYNAWTTDGWVLVTGAQTTTATAVLVQHNQFAIYKVNDRGTVTFHGTYGLPINTNIGTIFNPQLALSGRIRDSFSSTYYDIAKNIPYRVALDIEFIKS